MSALRRTSLLSLAGVLATAVFWLAHPASASAETADKLLPPETILVLHLNVQQLVKSKLFKKYVTKELRDKLRDDDLQQFEDATGINIFEDIHSVTVALTKIPRVDPTNPQDVDVKEMEMLVILRGDFAKDKLVRALKKSEPFGVRKYQGHEIFVKEAVSDDEPPTYICVAEDGLILASTKRVQLEKTLDAVAEGSAAKPINRDLKTVIDAVPRGHSFWLAVRNFKELKELAQNDPNAADLADKFVGVSLSVGIEDAIAVSLRAHTSDADAAKEVRAGFEKLRAFAVLWAANEKQMGPLVQDVLNTVKIAHKGNSASFEFELSEEVLKKLVELVQGFLGGREALRPKID